jgi:PLP dependent protein
LTADRRAELAANLDEVRGRIARACSAAGRDPSSVTLVAITKTYPAADVDLLASLGVTDVGENKDQEAAAKAAAVRATLRWHFVGQLQRNKARSVVRYADVVQSVDSVRLVAALSKAAVEQRTSPLEVLIQISLDGDPSRGGAVAPGGSAGSVESDGPVGSPGPAGDSLSVSPSSLSVPGSHSVAKSSRSVPNRASSDISGFPDAVDPERDLWRVADAVAAADGLRLGGVMAVAPIGWDPDRAFGKLARMAERVRAGHPGAVTVSAGMSGDLEAAIKHGATHVRIGTSLLGMRNTLR